MNLLILPKLFLCVSSSAVLTKTNFAVCITAKAAANFFKVPTKVLTFDDAFLPELPNLSKDFLPSSNLFLIYLYFDLKFWFVH